MMIRNLLLDSKEKVFQSMTEKPVCHRHICVYHEQIKHRFYLTVLSHFPVPLGFCKVSMVL